MDIDNDMSDTYMMDIDCIVLSPTGIIALDIITKEFSNLSDLYFTSSEYIEHLCTNIYDYLQDRESYLLSYTSKKAVDIIKLEYMYYINSNMLIIEAIRKYLEYSNMTEPVKQSNKRVHPNTNNMNKPNKKNKTIQNIMM